MRTPVQKRAAIARQKVNKAKKSVVSKVSVPMKTSSGSIKYGQRLTGRTAVPNLKAMKAKKVITTMD